MIEFTNAQLSAIALAADEAAIGKARELGFGSLEAALGLAVACESRAAAIVLTASLGPEVAGKLHEALEKANSEDLIAEAEGVLRGDAE